MNSLKPVLRTFSLSRDPVTPKKRSPLKAAAVPVELQNLLRLIESIEQESNNPNNSIYQPLPNNTSPKKQKEHAQKTRESVGTRFLLFHLNTLTFFFFFFFC